MPLNHVCMWNGTRWVHVKAEEASNLHPGGTVSAHSGLFVCELCGQYVCLTDGYIQRRHFRHSSDEDNKNCPDRSNTSSYRTTYNASDHELPIRISHITENQFSFELGFIRVPADLLDDDFTVKIGTDKSNYIYNSNRFNTDGITYLSIGAKPSQKYKIIIKGAQKSLREFWPSEVKGINPKGTLFKSSSGRMLVPDSDVRIDTKYYLVSKRPILNYYRNVEISVESKQTFGDETWFLYSVEANEYSEDAARFFMDYHYRLTDQPVRIRIVWPLYIEGNFFAKYNSEELIIAVNNNSTSFKTYPHTETHRLNYRSDEIQVFSVKSSKHQQLISTGRTSALEYLYLWQEKLDEAEVNANYKVWDLYQNQYLGGLRSELPPKQILQFQSEYDAELVLLENGEIVEIRNLNAEHRSEIDNIHFGMTIQLVIGLDTVWQASYEDCENIADLNDTMLFNLLKKKSNRRIPAPHSLRNIAFKMRNYPMVFGWINNCINNDEIGKYSYRILQKYCIESHLV